MNVSGFLKLQLQNIVEEVKSTLPDEIEFDFRKHVLPLFLPFLAWKDEIKNKQVLKADFLAGLIGAVIVLPQGIAFSMIAGLPPVYGLYTAMVTPVIAALFGSSRHLVSGPNTPISIVIFAAITKMASEGSPEYIEKVLFLTFLTGVIQLSLALGRMGRYISFVSQTVVVGFTAGAAVLIITAQMKGALGIVIPGSASFIEIWHQIFASVHHMNTPVLAVSAYSLLAGIIFKKYIPKIPYLIGGLSFGTALAWAMGGTAVGIPMVAEIPRQLPSFSVPGFSAVNFHELLSKAFAVAILGLIQTVAIGKSLAIQSGHQINGNQEFFGQGLSNIVGSFFSCYAGAGSFTRSGVNYEAGAKTPMAVIFAALILTVFMLVLAPYAHYLPSPALSGLIMMIGWGLIDFKHIREIRRTSKAENLILFATFFATLFAELEFAVYIGVLLSLYFFLRRTSTPNVAVMAPDPQHFRHQFVNIIRKDGLGECPQIKIIRIDGHLYFGAIDHISSIVREYRKGPQKHLVILANGINYVDLDGAEWLAREAAYWRKKGGGMYIVRLKIIAQDIMQSGGYMDHIGHSHFFNSKTDAFAEIYKKLDKQTCIECPRRIFLECAKDPSLPKLDTSVLETKPD